MEKTINSDHARRIRTLLEALVGMLHLDTSTMSALAAYKNGTIRELVIKHQSTQIFSAKHGKVVSGLGVPDASVLKLEQHLVRCGMSLDDDLVIYDEKTA